MTGPVPSATQVNKAGKAIRGFLLGEHQDIDALLAGMAILDRFRAAHQVPLTTATMGLRSMVKTEGCQVEVSQRLKRLPTILDKLRREPHMRLARMQDIGGCRAVLNSIDEVRRVERRLKRNRPVIRESDYVTTPRSSGYRGVHIVVEYHERAIEVQLRTRVMHAWAITIEGLSGRLRQDLKSGGGPTEVLELMQAISEAMAIEELGGTVEPEFLARLDALRMAAGPALRGR